MSHLNAAMRSKITYVKTVKLDTGTDTGEIEATVKEIIGSVRDRGDAALREEVKGRWFEKRLKKRWSASFLPMI